MPHWVLAAALGAVLLAIRLAYDAWAYREFYVKGRTPAQVERAEQLRTRGLVWLGTALVLDFLQRHSPQLNFLPYFEAVAFAGTFYYIFRAGQRVSSTRTITALLLVILGFGVAIAALYFGITPTSAGRTYHLTIASAGLIVLALAMFALASRLSRP